MKKAARNKESLLGRIIWSPNSWIAVILLAMALPLMLLTMGQKQTYKQHAATTHNVTIINYAMDPLNLTINAGDTVTWTNQDTDAHDVHSTTEVWDSPDMAKGESFSYTFNDPGTFEYYCTPHESIMNGYTITVLPAAEATVPATVAPTVEATQGPVSPTYECLGCTPTGPSVTIPEPTTAPSVAISPVPSIVEGQPPIGGGGQGGMIGLFLAFLQLLLALFANMFGS